VHSAFQRPVLGRLEVGNPASVALVAPAHALADLLVTSPQVEAAALFAHDAEPLGSVGGSDRWAFSAVRAGRTLLENAGEFRGVGEATQVHASLEGGDVFVIGAQRGPGIVAVTAPGQPAGLLFHDLKRCLAAIVEEPR
jgi:hypothetical protein